MFLYFLKRNSSETLLLKALKNLFLIQMNFKLTKNLHFFSSNSAEKRGFKLALYFALDLLNLVVITTVMHLPNCRQKARRMPM